MPSSTSNRFSVLSGEAPNPRDVQLEMQELQRPKMETEQTRMSEVSDVLVINSMTFLTVSVFGL